MLSLAFAPSSRAEITFTPSFIINETWTDNVNMAPSGQARSEFVTELTPSLAVVARNPRMQLAASYELRRYIYSDKDVPDLRDSSNSSARSGEPLPTSAAASA